MRGALTTYLSHHAADLGEWCALSFVPELVVLDRNPRSLGFLFSLPQAQSLAFDRVGVGSTAGTVWRMAFTAWPEPWSHAIWVYRAGSVNAERMQLYAGKPRVMRHDVVTPAGASSAFWMSPDHDDAAPCVIGFSRFLRKLGVVLPMGGLVPVYFTLKGYSRDACAS